MLWEDKRENTIKKQKDKGQKDVLDEIDLAGLEELNEAEQTEAWKLITEYIGIIAINNIDLGKTSLINTALN